MVCCVGVSMCVCVISYARYANIIVRKTCALCAISFYDTYPMLALFFINCAIFVVENWLNGGCFIHFVFHFRSEHMRISF